MLHTLQFSDNTLKLIHSIGRLHVKNACPTIRQSQKDLQTSTPVQLLVIHASSVETVVQHHCVEVSNDGSHASTYEQAYTIAHLHGNR